MSSHAELRTWASLLLSVLKGGDLLEQPAEQAQAVALSSACGLSDVPFLQCLGCHRIEFPLRCGKPDAAAFFSASRDQHSQSTESCECGKPKMSQLESVDGPVLKYINDVSIRLQSEPGN